MAVRRRALVTGLGITAAAVLISAASWACVPVATVTLAPPEARPGDEVTVSGIRFPTSRPVVLRLHSMQGPILATIDMPRSANTLFTTKIRVPADATPGPLVVLAMQDHDAEIGFAGWGVPARAIISVLDAEGRAPPTTISAVPGRPSELATEEVDAGLVVVLVLGVAAGALLMAGVATVIAGRQSAPKAAAVAPPEGASSA